MTIPMLGILIVGGIALIFGLFCMISEFIQVKKFNEMYDEVPEGYWDNVEQYLANKPPLPPEPKDNDPPPAF